jgi:predicted O-methyltransferase YrrM
MRVSFHFILWHLNLAKPNTWPPREAEYFAFIERWARGRKRLVEIGCWQGVTTAQMRRAMVSDGVIYAVDPYEPGRLNVSFSRIIAHRTVAKVPRGQVCWLEKTEIEAAAWAKRQQDFFCDFVYADSGPSYERLRDAWESWKPLVQSGGVFITAGSRRFPVEAEPTNSAIRFCDEVMRVDPKFKLVEEFEDLTVFEKREGTQS